jgi:hypothetical protein
MYIKRPTPWKKLNELYPPKRQKATARSIPRNSSVNVTITVSGGAVNVSVAVPAEPSPDAPEDCLRGRVDHSKTRPSPCRSRGREVQNQLSTAPGARRIPTSSRATPTGRRRAQSLAPPRKSRRIPSDPARSRMSKIKCHRTPVAAPVAGGAEPPPFRPRASGPRRRAAAPPARAAPQRTA